MGGARKYTEKTVIRNRMLFAADDLNVFESVRRCDSMCEVTEVR